MKRTVKKYMKLTKHFSIEEFERSERAKRLGINNTVPKALRPNIQALCENVLEPVRNHFEVPIHISSGYRCTALNKAVGGAPKSQHMKGQAADIYIKNQEMPLKAVWDWMVKHLDYDQIIWETRPSGSKWIHVSYVSEGRNRHKALRCEDGKHYLPFRAM
ncbi:MAG: DUF882 domain-containing protein [Bacteroidaceae bacterium]|nr:DUF882 domain-containing protein [Bacteroidaceae bacterium]